MLFGIQLARFVASTDSAMMGTTNTPIAPIGTEWESFGPWATVEKSHNTQKRRPVSVFPLQSFGCHLNRGETNGRSRQRTPTASRGA